LQCLTKGILFQVRTKCYDLIDYIFHKYSRQASSTADNLLFILILNNFPEQVPTHILYHSLCN